MRFAEQRDLFPMQHAAACLRGDVGTCLAPCAGRCTHGDYARQLAAARALLDGLDRLPLERLEAQMAQASAALQFERAGALRDAWDRLTYLAGEIELVRDVRQDYWFVYPTPGHGGRTHWNLIAGGDVAAVVRSPESPASAHRCLEALEAAYAGQRHRSLAPPDDYGQLRLVASWFRQHPGEIDRVLEPAAALARCRDYR
jgi:excinuclease ABC subunit C